MVNHPGSSSNCICTQWAQISILWIIPDHSSGCRHPRLRCTILPFLLSALHGLTVQFCPAYSSLNLSYGAEWRGYDRAINTDKSAYVKEHLKEIKVSTQYKLFFSICLFCGLRKGEALALKWEDIDFEKLEISITKSVGMTATGIDYKEPKTPNSIRRVPFPEDLLPLLREYKKEYTILRLEHGTAWKGDGNIFMQKDGKMFGNTVAYQYFIAHLNRYNKWVREHAEQAKAEGLLELPIIPLHGLRHSCATLLNYLEVNIVDVSKYLGHSDCSTTMNIYAHSFEEQQHAVSNKLNEFLRINAL